MHLKAALQGVIYKVQIVGNILLIYIIFFLTSKTGNLTKIKLNYVRMQNLFLSIRQYSKWRQEKQRAQ